MNLGEETRELQVEPLQWPQPRSLPHEEPATMPQTPATVPAEEVPA